MEAIESTEEGKNEGASSIFSRRKTARTPPEDISLNLAAPKKSRNPKTTLKGHTEPINLITSDLKRSRAILISHDLPWPLKPRPFECANSRTSRDMSVI